MKKMLHQGNEAYMPAKRSQWIFGGDGWGEDISIAVDAEAEWKASSFAFPR